MGHLERPGARASAAPRGPRTGRGRARLWHGLRLILALAQRCPPGRARQLREAARDGSDVPDEFGIRFPLVHADAERTPLRDGSFDLAISEYGAAIWCDPYRWIPEAARILRPGGELVFLGRSYLSMLTSPDEDLPATEQLQRDHFGMHRFIWPDADGAVEFALTHGDMIRLLRDSGFEVKDLVEVQAPEGAETPADPLATAEWSRRWPIEEVWKARKAG